MLNKGILLVLDFLNLLLLEHGLKNAEVVTCITNYAFPASTTWGQCDVCECRWHTVLVFGLIWGGLRISHCGKHVSGSCTE